MKICRNPECKKEIEAEVLKMHPDAWVCKACHTGSYSSVQRAGTPLRLNRFGKLVKGQVICL